jgi:hypothetical protein
MVGRQQICPSIWRNAYCHHSLRLVKLLVRSSTLLRLVDDPTVGFIEAWQAGRINGSRLPWSVIDRRSQRALRVTLKFKESEGKALLIQDPYLFSREIDYVPCAHADMDARCGKAIPDMQLGLGLVDQTMCSRRFTMRRGTLWRSCRFKKVGIWGSVGDGRRDSRVVYRRS